MSSNTQLDYNISREQLAERLRIGEGYYKRTDRGYGRIAKAARESGLSYSRLYGHLKRLGYFRREGTPTTQPLPVECRSFSTAEAELLAKLFEDSNGLVKSLKKGGASQETVDGTLDEIFSLLDDAVSDACDPW